MDFSDKTDQESLRLSSIKPNLIGWIFYRESVKQSNIYDAKLSLSSQYTYSFSLPHTLFSRFPTGMHFYWALLSQAAAALAVKLYVADSGGNVTTLILSQSLSTSNLSVSYKTNSCAPNPSWLILDGENKLLYCYDRGATSSINGSMNSFSVAEDGNLTSVARVNAPFSGVHARIFGEGNKRGIATAS